MIKKFAVVLAAILCCNILGCGEPGRGGERDCSDCGRGQWGEHRTKR